MKYKAIDKYVDGHKQLEDEKKKLEKKRRKKRRALILGIIFVPLLFLGGLSCFLGKDEV